MRMKPTKRSASAFVRSWGTFARVTTTPGRTGSEELYVSGRFGDWNSERVCSSVISATSPPLSLRRDELVARVLTVKLAGSSRQRRKRSTARCTRLAYSLRDEGLKSL